VEWRGLRTSGRLMGRALYCAPPTLVDRCRVRREVASTIEIMFLGGYLWSDRECIVTESGGEFDE
jgi:hypothetical protein